MMRISKGFAWPTANDWLQAARRPQFRLPLSGGSARMPNRHGMGMRRGLEDGICLNGRAWVHISQLRINSAGDAKETPYIVSMLGVVDTRRFHDRSLRAVSLCFAHVAQSPAHLLAGLEFQRRSNRPRRIRVGFDHVEGRSFLCREHCTTPGKQPCRYFRRG